MEASFDSAWHKWAWAVRHARALEHEIEVFTAHLPNQGILAVRSDYEPKRHAFAITITDLTPLPTDWSLRLGDIAFNFRSALDHIAWAVVSRGRTPPDTLTEKGKRSVQLPITKSSKDFSAKAPRNLPGARRADLTLLRRHQPYHADHRRRGSHPLVHLAEFNNLDKHREIQPVWGTPTWVDPKITECRDCVVTDTRITGRAVPLKVGAELGTIRVRRTGPDPKLVVEPHITAQVAFRDTTVIVWLDKTEAEILALLAAFSEPPPEHRQLINTEIPLLRSTGALL